MTQLEFLQLENDLSGWVNYNMPDVIERKFVELIEPFLDQDEFLVIWSRYLTGKANPALKNVNRDGLQWNVSGTHWLAGLLHATMSLIPRINSSKKKPTKLGFDDDVIITKI